ncbi:MAG: ATP-binding protein [Mesorhizobium sp.]|nr:ATP-binding protein [Mesorhizobium sp.]
MPGESPTDAARGGGRSTKDSHRPIARDSARRGIYALRHPFAGAAGLLSLGIAQASAAERASVLQLADGMTVGTFEVIQVAVFAGVMGAALLSAIWLIRERGRIAADNLELRGRIAELSTSLQRSDALLNLKDQRLIVWMKDRTKPNLVGSLGLAAGIPEERGAFLAFGRWLTSRSATALERAIADLRARGTTFELVAETQHGSLLEVHGRVSATTSVVRFVSLSDAQKAHARLKAEHAALAAEYDSVRGLIDALPMPFWLRESDGRLRWVNTAYATAVEAAGPAEAVRDGKELLGTPVRETIAQHGRDHRVYEQTVSTVIRGDRRLLAVTNFTGQEASAGIAADRSEIEGVREELSKVQRSHSETLDQLTTAVAIFDAQEKLRFYNQAFQKLWDLDSGFLDSAPANALLLDRLRTDGKIPEQPEWRRWKEGVLAAYRAVESREDWWHLPDSRTIRVVANPHPAGGVTWVFENLTEKMDLESRYNAAVRVQGETLDNLAEGVAVFGPDGRLRLSNPAFAKLWGLSEELARPNTHIATIRGACDLYAKDSPWPDFVADVTGFSDERRDRHGQAEMSDGSILRFALIQLPNGQVMMTFVDVTDTVNVERALKDKNEALQMADQLKNDFVQHVSYELRSPLTNIIGFTELLALPETGPLSPKQRDYLGHIGSSSSVLLTIVNDILDLATVDAGIMELDIGEIDVDRIVASASDLIAERLREHGIKLDVDLSAAPRSFHADENRVRQVLFNLLSNAVNYAPDNGTIQLTCRGNAGEVEFSVHDDGPGIPPEVLDTVYRRFESRANGGRRRGAGLGLSIVKSFVELHGGAVSFVTAPGQGTTVICRFPPATDRMRPAAE